MILKNLFGIKNNRLKVAIDAVSQGVVIGWVSGADEYPIKLRILIDDIFIGVVETSVMRKDLLEPLKCGFFFDFSRHIKKIASNKLEIFDEATGKKLTNAPILLEKKSGWGCVDSFNGNQIKGWAVTPELTQKDIQVELLVDGVFASLAHVNEPRNDLVFIGLPKSEVGFSLYIPSKWFDGKKHKASVRIKASSNLLRSGHFDFEIEIKGAVDQCSYKKISGWILNARNHTHQISFDIKVNGRVIKTGLKPSLLRHDVGDSVLGIKSLNEPVGFDVNLDDVEFNKEIDVIEICSPDGSNILSQKYYLLSRYKMMKEFDELQKDLFPKKINSSKLSSKYMFQHLFTKQLIPNFETHIRQTLRSSNMHDPILIKIDSYEDITKKYVDVIVPVYKGYKETLDCIFSVLASGNTEILNLVVINDASPDTRLSHSLRRLSDEKNFTLIENDTNLGFVATVNKGMKLHSDRDIVLLNSDTLVPHGWLGTLQHSAYSSSNIASVTPLSNKATIFSLPRTNFDNDMPLGMTVDEVNNICASSNTGVLVDVPTGMGFCMYIRRDALSEVGYFDEAKWGSGYGEENDFSIKSSNLGWRNIAACDVFVQHHGSVSFGINKTALIEGNYNKLLKMYPEYQFKVKEFLEFDPLASARGRVNVEFFKRLASQYILFVSHSWGGGTEKAIQDLCNEYLKENKVVLVLRALENKMILSICSKGYNKDILSEYPLGDYLILADHLKHLNISYVHFHHTIGFNKEIWKLPELLGVPYDVLLHDFFTVCPQINLIDNTGTYCDQPSIEVCEKCVHKKSPQLPAKNLLKELGGTVEAWRSFHQRVLVSARNVTVPSQNTYEHLRQYSLHKNIQIVPHSEDRYTFAQRPWDGKKPYKVAVIGAIGEHKGSKLLLECAEYAINKSLPIEFVVVGYTNNDSAFEGLENVHITGAYTDDTFERIVTATGCCASLFLSVWPETYSYTLSEALRSGLYPIVMDIGAPAERLRESGIGAVIPFDNNPRNIMSNVLSVLENIK